jgi:molybdopterin molybdotransferase
MTPLEEVRALVLAHCTRGPVVSLPLMDARGLVLAEPVISAEQVPPFANTAVDGYAVRASDVAQVPVELRVIDEVAAGAVAQLPVSEGTAIRIMTGAPIPDGCDAIVMVEDTERVGDDGVRILKSVAVTSGIRDAGSDVEAGAVVFQPGVIVTPMVEGVLASINARTVSVVWRPRVGVISTGDELVDDGSPLQKGQIRESNRKMLLRLVDESGAEAIDLGIIRDNEEDLEDTLRKATSLGMVDALITSGGVSMGDYDVVKAVLARIAEMHWFQIAMKPAKPFAFGTMPGVGESTVPIFGLPGNPVSSLMSDCVGLPRGPHRQARTYCARPAYLGHRPMQFSLHVLHARRGLEVARQSRSVVIRRDRACLSHSR